MLEVQKYLESHFLQDLEREYAIKWKQHTTLPLVILNYDQIKSPKNNSISNECRGLVLENSSWNVVAKSFNRFFNLGEVSIDFNWNNFTALSKEDGTLIILYNHSGRWFANTRQTFGDGKVGETEYTWEDLVCKALYLSNLQELTLNPNYSYICELCSPYNKIVTQYTETNLFLLSVFYKEDELEENLAEEIWRENLISWRRPVPFKFNSQDEVAAFISTLAANNPTFEGIVLRDNNNHRIKVKSTSYLALHRLSNNGSVGSWRNIVKLILENEIDEVLTYFPEFAVDFNKWSAILRQEYKKLRQVFLDSRDIEKQKDFAIFINGSTPYTSLLFSLRKQSLNQEEDLEKSWRQSCNLITKVLEKNYVLT